MNLDQVTIDIKPRQAWEAVDLGAHMARRWWWPMMKIWFIVSFPFFLFSLLIPQDNLIWAIVLIWWLKPIYERPLLFYLSHAVFGDLPSLGASLRAFPKLAFKQIFLSLTWRRFSFSRSMDLPILQLEGLSGSRRQERLMVLHREDSSPIGWMHCLGFFLEFFIANSILGLVWFLMPKEIDVDWLHFFWSFNSSTADYIQHLVQYLAMWLVAPFYVASGFALYLNRRIKLEAWDLDIAFRRMANKRQPSFTTPLLMLLSILMFANLPQDSQAQEVQTQEVRVQEFNDHLAQQLEAEEPLGERIDLDRKSAKQSIDWVLNQKEFSQKEVMKRLKLKETDDDNSAFIKWLLKLLDGSDAKGISFGGIFELAIWLGLIFLVAIIIYRYRHWLAAQFVKVGPVSKPKEKPVTLFGMDVRQETLPEDVNSTALEFIRKGDKRAALALLYRASLAHLIYSGVEIEDGFTELECMQKMRVDLLQLSRTEDDVRYNNERIDYFSTLTTDWRRLAYGHIYPDDQHAIRLCSSWNQCWLQQDWVAGVQS